MKHVLHGKELSTGKSPIEYWILSIIRRSKLNPEGSIGKRKYFKIGSR